MIHSQNQIARLQEDVSPGPTPAPQIDNKTLAKVGSVGITDLLVVVLIADAAQNAMAGEYKSITEGALLVSTIVFWSYAFDWLGFRLSWFRRFIHPDPLCLVKEGRTLRHNLKRELITEEELMSQIRLHGIMDVKDVKEALMEGDGRISVVPYESGDSPGTAQ